MKAPFGSPVKARSAAARSSSTATMSSEGAPLVSEMVESGTGRHDTVPAMKRGQIAIAVLAAVAVAVVAFLSSGGDGGGSGQGGGGASGDQKAPGGALRIPFAYSPEK